MSATTLEAGVLPQQSVFRDRNLRWYLGGQLISLTGSMLQSSVILIFLAAILGKTEATRWSGIYWALGLIPGTFLAPFAGMLLDRWNKRVVLIVTAVIGALQALAFALITWHPETATLWEIGTLGLVMGFVNAIDGPGRNAIVKDIVQDKRNTRQAAKMFTALYNIGQIAGPGFAGFLVLACGYPMTFILNALSFAALIIALLKVTLVILPADGRRAGSGHTMMQQTVHGLRYVIEEPGLRLCTILTTGVVVLGFSYYVLLAVISKYQLHGTEFDYSKLCAAQGVGSILGSVAVIGFGDRLSHKLLVVGGMIIAAAGLLMLAWTADLRIAATGVFLAGLGFVVSFSTLRASIMHISEPERVGVVIGWAFSFFYGGMMSGSLCIGPIANTFGIPATIATCGVLLLVLAAATPFMKGIDELG